MTVFPIMNLTAIPPFVYHVGFPLVHTLWVEKYKAASLPSVSFAVYIASVLGLTLCLVATLLYGVWVLHYIGEIESASRRYDFVFERGSTVSGLEDGGLAVVEEG